MTTNSFESYYVNQAGSGIAGFSGVKYQRGHGFFGRLLSGAVLPILKYLGKKALNTGVGIGSDIIQGENIKSSMKKRLKKTGFDIAEDTYNKLQNYKQKGSGKRRKKKHIKKKSGRKLSILQLRALAKGRQKLKIKRSRKPLKKTKKSKRSKKSKNSLF